MILFKGEAALNWILARYVKDAKRRNLVFKLSREDFRGLTKSPCFYCGEPPTRAYVISAPVNGGYSGNGVDRKDSKLGYTTDNCVACCFLCNRMKSDLSVEDFVKHCTAVTEKICTRDFAPCI